MVLRPALVVGAVICPTDFSLLSFFWEERYIRILEEQLSKSICIYLKKCIWVAHSVDCNGYGHELQGSLSSFRVNPSCRQLPCSRTHPVQRTYIQWFVTWWYKSLAIWGYCGTTVIVYIPEHPVRLLRFCQNYTVVQLLPLTIILPSPSFHECWFLIADSH